MQNPNTNPERKGHAVRNTLLIGAFAVATNVATWFVTSNYEKSHHADEYKQFEENKQIVAQQDVLIGLQEQLLTETETMYKLEIEKTIKEGIVVSAIILPPGKETYIRAGQMGNIQYECVGALALDQETGMSVSADEQCAAGPADANPEPTSVPGQDKGIKNLEGLPIIQTSAL